MALTAQHKDTKFGAGDKVKVTQKIKEAGKSHTYSFEGMVIGIRGMGENRSFIVRKIGDAQIGVERIFPLASPTIAKVEVTKRGTRGVRRAKLYYTRRKSKKEIDKIYARSAKRQEAKKKSIKSRKKDQSNLRN